MRIGRRPRGAASRWLWAALVAALAVLAGVALSQSHVAQRWEADTVDWRFQQRSAQPPDDVAVVAIDDVTFSRLLLSWPFPRSLHARAIDRLTAAGARVIVYDVQFTEPTRRAEDLALYRAVASSGRVVLATSEVDHRGRTNVLGGDDRLGRAGARAGASNLLTGSGEVIRRFPHSVGGLESLAVVAAERITGRELPPSQFPSDGAWIDFRGPPGTVPTSSFSDLLAGRIPDEAFRGKIVVVGASAPTLQDVHATPTADDRPMAGAEVQANAIGTALRGLPLRSAPSWSGLLAVTLLALVAPLAGMLRSALVLAGAVLAAALAYPALALVLFGQGWIVPVVAPLATLGLATAGTLVGGSMRDARLRRREEQRAAWLESVVRERTAELRAAQLEIVERLARAAEWREEETGQHISRVGRLAEALAGALGMSPAEAEELRVASTLHDIGKIGLPDAVLLRQGALDSEQWKVAKTHTVIGAEILSGSSSELVRTAEQIARSHHERWDGSGYPSRLAGERIPFPGRICAVCDVFDALCSRRHYKVPWSLEAAMAEIQAGSGSRFDPRVVDAFLGIAGDLYRDLGYESAPRDARAPAVVLP